MNTVAVWLFVFTVRVWNGGGPAVIDNIATRAECERVRDVFIADGLHGRCVEVWKVVPKQ